MQRLIIPALVVMFAFSAGAQQGPRGRKVAEAPTSEQRPAEPKAVKPVAPPADSAVKKAADAGNSAAGAAVPQTPSALRGPMRIDFDDRLVQGQTNKLGAVYLYQRKDPAQPSLLERRSSFRDEIVRDLVE